MRLVPLADSSLFVFGCLLTSVIPDLNQKLAYYSPYPLLNALSLTMVSIPPELLIALSSPKDFLWRWSDIRRDLVCWIPLIALFSGMSGILVQYCYSEVDLDLVVAFSFFPFLLMTIFVHRWSSFSFGFLKVFSLVAISLGLIIRSTCNFRDPGYMVTLSRVILLVLTGLCGFISTMIVTLWKLQFQTRELNCFRSLMILIRIIASLLLFLAFYIFELPLIPSPLFQLFDLMTVLRIVSIVTIVEFTSFTYSRIRNSLGSNLVDFTLFFCFFPFFFTDFVRYANVQFHVRPMIGLVLSLGAYYIYSFGDLWMPRNLSRYFYVYSIEAAERGVINADFLTVALPPVHELPFVSTFELLAERSDGLSNMGQYVHWSDMKSRWARVYEEHFSNVNKLPLL
jgi:hypothetical protein